MLSFGRWLYRVFILVDSCIGCADFLVDCFSKGVFISCSSGYRMCLFLADYCSIDFCTVCSLISIRGRSKNKIISCRMCFVLFLVDVCTG